MPSISVSDDAAQPSSSSSKSPTTAPRPPLTILYASATGTASDLAHRLSRLAQQHHYSPSIHSLSSFPDLPSLHDAISCSAGPVVFLIATAGNGSFPTAAEPLWKDALSARYQLGEELQGLQFAIFGLGDSSYPRFCWPERMLRKRLVDLGGSELLRGEGDEQHYLGIEGTFQPFLSELFGLLDERYPLPQGLEVLPNDAIMPPTFELRFLDEEHHGESNGSGSGSSTLQKNGGSSRAINGVGHHDASMASSPSTTADSDIRWMSTVRNERITSPDHWQDVRRLEFTLPDSDELDVEYEAGDIATLRPANDAGMVDALIARMGWMSHRDRPVGLFDRNGRRIQLPPLSKPLTDAGAVEETMTLHSYLVNHTSPFSPLRPSLFPLLRPFSPKGHLEREKLDEFCTPGDGYEDAMEYGVRTRRTIAEVLDEFQSVQFEPRWAAEVFGGGNEEGEGGMREREFSIACGPSESPRSLTLLISLVSYKTRIREPRVGVLSRWLATLEPSKERLLPVRIKKSSMLKLSASESTPLIAIGPGTGMAPLRGLVRERVARARARKAAAAAGAAGPASSFQPFGPILLLFGCRAYPHSDALLQREWSDLAAECAQQGLGTIYVRWASSRWDPLEEKTRGKGEKEYVQDLVDQWDHLLTPPGVAAATGGERQGDAPPPSALKQGPLIWDWLTAQRATVYLCGSSGNMPQQVRRAFERLVSEFGGLEEDQATRFLDRIETGGRWREECWS